MVKKNQEGDCPTNVIRITDELGRFVLVELAWNRDFEADIDRDAPQNVCVRCSQDDFADLLEQARKVEKRLVAREFEIVAEAVAAAGGTPSAALVEAINEARVQAGLSEQPELSPMARLSLN